MSDAAFAAATAADAAAIAADNAATAADAASAATATRAAASVATRAAAFAALAATTTIAATTAATASDAATAATAFAAATADRDTVWATINVDAQWLVEHEGEGLIHQPLWLVDVQGGSNDTPSPPDWIHDALDRFPKSGLAEKEGWGLWIDWYRAILPDPADAEPKSLFGREIDIEIATQEPDFWDGDPDEVMANISRLVGREPAKHGAKDEGLKGSAPSTSSQSNAAIWLAQFKRGDRVSEWLEEARSGSEIAWQVGQANIDSMRADDRVVYWRTVTKSSDRGGIVGTGTITSRERQTDEHGVSRVPTIVGEFYDDNPLPRDDVISETGLHPGSWQFSLYKLPEDVANKMDAYIRRNGRDPWPDADRTKPQGRSQSHEVEQVSDRPETDRDLLGRAPLAFAIAAQINRIWTAATGDSQKPSWWRRACDSIHITRFVQSPRQPDDAAFILHIDSPWGGGKTTFANFIARILNPGAFGLDGTEEKSDFLKDLPLDDDTLWKPEYRKRGWHIVQFNAWQHEHVSPPWWNFYEVIRRQCLDGLSKSGLKPEPDRGQRFLSGPFRRLSKSGRWLGYEILEAAWRIWSPATQRAAVTTLLVGAIACLAYWTGLYEWLKDRDLAGVKLSDVAAIVATGSVGVVIFGALRSGVATVVKSVSGSVDEASLGESDPLHRFQKHFSWFVRQLDAPVLVIVDDLDRCQPKFIVELVRGLLTIFRSPRVVFMLLGDKSWIEEAFAQVHTEMEDAHRDEEISFGGRFVEKALQLSFILPEASEEERNNYLVAVLTGKRPVSGTDKAEEDRASTGDGEREEAAGLARKLRDVERLARERFAETRDTEDLVDVKTKTRDEIDNIFAVTGDGASNDLTEHYRQAARRAIEVEASYRSSTSDQSEADIRHGVVPVSAYLPSNPRRIKRIVNMIGAFQESGQIAESIDPLSRKWRQLVLWTVIMSEYPQIWRTLVLDKAVASDAIGHLGNAEEDGSVKLPPLAKNASEADRSRRRSLAEVVSDRGVVRLLRGDPFNDADDDHAIDEATLEWLRRLTPIR